MKTNPHFVVREDWLAKAHEQIIAPEQPILDMHHHLWVRPDGRYVASELMEDISCGRDVRASIYVQCRTGYKTDVKPALQPVGEVETILEWCQSQPDYPAAIVAFADLELGGEVRRVPDQLLEAGRGKVRGIRNTTAYHADPPIRSNANPPPDGLLRSEAFLEGAKTLPQCGLTLDVWAYHTQLREVRDLAAAMPDLTVVIDHCGGSLGVGPYRTADPAVLAEWRRHIAALAQLPNTRVKIGGLGLTVLGHPLCQRTIATPFRTACKRMGALFQSLPRELRFAARHVREQFSCRQRSVQLWHPVERVQTPCERTFIRGARRSLADRVALLRTR